MIIDYGRAKINLDILIFSPESTHCIRIGRLVLY